jgi:hypothetical protein
VEKTVVVLRRPLSRKPSGLPNSAAAAPSRPSEPAPSEPAPLGSAPLGLAMPGPASPLWSGVIRGEPTPRSRMLDVFIADGTPHLIKSRPARVWQNRAMPQLLNHRPKRPLAVELVLDCRVWSAAARPIDETLVVDVLERAAIIAHAGQIREKHVFTAVDRADPRVAVTLTRLQPQS